MPVKEKTTLNIDRKLARDAAKILGTSKITETVNQALRQIVRHQQLQLIAARSIEHSRKTRPETLEGLRVEAWQRSKPST